MYIYQMSEISPVLSVSLLPNKNELLVNEKESTIYLNNSKLCKYTNESYSASNCYKEFQKYIESVKYTGQIDTKFVGRKCQSWESYEAGYNKSWAGISDRGQITFF
jgi:hypothetical protein